MIKQLVTKILIGIILSVMLGLGAVYADSPSTGTSDQTSAVTEPSPDSMSDDEISGFGCILGGLSMFSASYLAGPSESIMLWGGGLLTPSGSGVLAVSILGGLGFAGCSIGATVAPTFVWASQQIGTRPATAR